MRIKLWEEIRRAQMNPNRGFFIEQVYSGVCSHATLYTYVRIPTHVAWLMCPPADYDALNSEELHLGHREMRKLLDAPIYDKNGKLDKIAVDAKIKIFALLDARKHGAYVQKIQQQNLNITADAKDVQKMIDGMTQEDIDKKIKELEVKGKPVLPDILAELAPAPLPPVPGLDGSTN